MGGSGLSRPKNVIRKPYSRRVEIEETIRAQG